MDHDPGSRLTWLEHRTVDPKVGGSIPLTHPTCFSPVIPRRSMTYEGEPRKLPFHHIPSFSAVFCINPARKSRPSSGAARGWGRLSSADPSEKPAPNAPAGPRTPRGVWGGLAARALTRDCNSLRKFAIFFH